LRGSLSCICRASILARPKPPLQPRRTFVGDKKGRITPPAHSGQSARTLSPLPVPARIRRLGRLLFLESSNPRRTRKSRTSLILSANSNGSRKPETQVLDRGLEPEQTFSKLLMIAFAGGPTRKSNRRCLGLSTFRCSVVERRQKHFVLSAYAP